MLRISINGTLSLSASESKEERERRRRRKKGEKLSEEQRGEESFKLQGEGFPLGFSEKREGAFPNTIRGETEAKRSEETTNSSVRRSNRKLQK